MMESGKAMSEKDMEYKYGQMEPNTKENGSITRRRAKESSLTLMAIFMMEIGNKIKHQVMGYTFIITELNIKAIG